jgi:hypothetical protein
LQKQWLSGHRAFLLILLENPRSHRSREGRFTLADTGGAKYPDYVQGLPASAVGGFHIWTPSP